MLTYTICLATISSNLQQVIGDQVKLFYFVDPVVNTQMQYMGSWLNKQVNAMISS